MDAVGHAPLRQRPAAASDGNRAWSKSGEISSSENWKCVQRHLMVLAWHQVTPTMDGNDSRMGPFRYLVWLLPLSLHALCRAQRITIRLIDVRNRCPPPNRQVSLSLLCDKGESTPDRKSTRLNSSHSQRSYAVFCLKKKKKIYILINFLKKKYILLHNNY